MGRHKKSIDRPVMPDVKYNSKVVSKFITRMMLQGKKETCKRLMYTAMDNLKAKTDKDPLEVFLKALENVKPMVEVKSRRVGGATYQVPVEIRDVRKEALAMRWIITAAPTATDTVWPKRSPPNCSMRTTARVRRLRKKKIRTKWPKRTKRSRTTAGNFQRTENRSQSAVHVGGRRFFMYEKKFINFFVSLLHLFCK